MSLCVLGEARLLADTVATFASHAMKVGGCSGVGAFRVSAVFVSAELLVTFWHVLSLETTAAIAQAVDSLM